MVGCWDQLLVHSTCSRAPSGAVGTVSNCEVPAQSVLSETGQDERYDRSFKTPWGGVLAGLLTDEEVGSMGAGESVSPMGKSESAVTR
jgi:hypothetical protein